MGERACYREFCPTCEMQVTIVSEACPDCGTPLETE
jgi:predicted amidophosphoribosyltransferase